MSIKIRYLANDDDTARLYLYRNAAADPVERNIYHSIDEIPKANRHYAEIPVHRISIGVAEMYGADVVRELYPDAKPCEHFKGKYCILDGCKYFKDMCLYPTKVGE